MKYLSFIGSNLSFTISFYLGSSKWWKYLQKSILSNLINNAINSKINDIINSTSFKAVCLVKQHIEKFENSRDTQHTK